MSQASSGLGSQTARFAVLGFVALSAGFLLRADLTRWAENAITGSALEAAFYRMMDLPGGPVLARRSPKESKEQLDGLITKSPNQADLYSLRAQEEERLLDFSAAEADWKRASELNTDRTAGQLDLANYYQRRAVHQQEVAALIAAGKQPETASEKFLPIATQRSWTAFTRALQVAALQKFPWDQVEPIYTAWIDRWPKQPEPYQRYFQALINQKATQNATSLLDRYRATFPEDQRFALEGEAQLARLTSGPQAELEVYAKNFNPLWPDNLRKRYYQVLNERHELRAFLAAARSDASAQPDALHPVSRLFFYYEQQEKLDAARQALLEFEARREAKPNVAWTVEELRTMAALFRRAHDHNETARAFYSLYHLPNVSVAAKREGLSGLANMLLDVPEQSIRFGSGDLSLYKNIGQADPHPGFLNGILSFALNTTNPAGEFQNESQNAVSYFHRAAASQLIARLDREFPSASETPGLQAKLFTAYGVYGEDDALIRLIPSYLTKYKDAPTYVNTALLLADAYSRKKRQNDEFALYDQLLKELSSKSEGVPLGSAGIANGPAHVSISVRSPDYARVLDRYISQLVAAKRLRDAVALYRREIDQNPNDPGLYARLAAFVEQNKFDADLVATYRQAMQRFPDTSWAQKLARFYLRTKRDSDYQQLTRELTNVFSGADLEEFVRQVPPTSSVNPALYLQVNLYAHQRFPHNMLFVRNLLHAYQAKGTANPAAREKLLRENWFYDDSLRAEYFELLSQTARLQTELSQLPKNDNSNPAAITFEAEANSWLCHFEEAAPAFAKLASLTPGDQRSGVRAVSVHRSLAGLNTPGALETAIQLAGQLSSAQPSNQAFLTEIGEIYADREEYAQARPYWNKLASLEPGNANGYLESATVFWDYFLYDDALRLMGEGRRVLGNPSQYAYEAGAIYENKQDFSRAVDEYLKAALETPATGSNGLAESRLLQLASRRTTRDLVEQRSIAALGNSESMEALRLRVALLEKQDRREDIHQTLEQALRKSASLDAVAEIQRTAERLDFADTIEHSLSRTIALSRDPVEKLRARLDLANFRENRKDLTGAAKELDALYRENPALLGIVRANTDFYWRTKQPQKAVALLEESAQRAQEPYRKQLLREAADKATDSQQYATARRILDGLIAADPYNGDLLAAKASTYAKEGDDQTLAQFYASQLDGIQKSTLSAQDKTNKAAALRRGYVQALTRLKKYPEALDQYIEIINRYPEDESLVREAARFAEGHQLQSKLIDYYEQTSQKSPKDYRWPLVVARAQTTLRHYPEAVTAYERASVVRPDRTDLLNARAELEERLFRFDDVLKTYQRLYELGYHDPQYLEKQAAVYARLGRPAEATKLLRAAWIENRPANTELYFRAGQQLANWNMLAEARQLYEEGLALIPPAELATASGFASYLEVLVRLRQPEIALQKTSAALSAASAPVGTSAWIQRIGSAVELYYTPEEKTKFAQLLEAPGKVPAALNGPEIARSAGLADLAARRLAQQAMAGARWSKVNPRWRELESYQRSRLQFRQLGRQLEDLIKATPVSQQDRDSILQAAAQAYRDAADNAGELRIAALPASNGASIVDPPRYAQLLARNQAALLPLLRQPGKERLDFANQLTQSIIERGGEGAAFQAVSARGGSQGPLWTNAYTALTGLYYQSAKSNVTQAFATVLGPRTVGEQLTRKAMPSDSLSGDTWFYYASRYGEYLRNDSSADEYLAAEPESAPVASQSYFTLGEFYRVAKQSEKARVQYEYAREITPVRVDVLDRLALLAWDAGKQDEAVAQWKEALVKLRQQGSAGAVSPNWWQTASSVLLHLNQRGVLNQAKAEADAMLLEYVARNGAYQFEPLTEALLSTRNRAEAVSWILDLSRSSKTEAFLSNLLQSGVLQETEKEPVYRELIKRQQVRVATLFGEQARNASNELVGYQAQFARYLLDQQKPAAAWTVLSEIKPPEQQPKELMLEAAAKSGKLDALLADYKVHPERALSGEGILGVARKLRKDGQTAAAQRLLEFEYERQLAGEYPPATAYLGLAQVRLEQKRVADALPLLEQVTLSVGAPFENLSAAGRILEEAGQKKEAARYYEQWQKAEPWNPEAKLALARTTDTPDSIDAVRMAESARYETRTAAARALRALNTPRAGTTELDLLTQSSITPEQAKQSYFTGALLDAAEHTQEPSRKTELYRLAIARKPDLREPRLALAETAIRSKQDALGIEAYESYAQPQGADVPDERWQLSSLVAEAYRRLGRTDQAIAVYEQAVRLAPDEAQRKTLDQKLRQVRIRQELEARNASRRPTVSNEVQQDHVVQPRLTSLAGEENLPPSLATAIIGGAQ